MKNLHNFSFLFGPFQIFPNSFIDTQPKLINDKFEEQKKVKV